MSWFTNAVSSVSGAIKYAENVYTQIKPIVSMAQNIGKLIGGKPPSAPVSTPAPATPPAAPGYKDSPVSLGSVSPNLVASGPSALVMGAYALGALLLVILIVKK